MNRAYTVFLDQLNTSHAGSLPKSVVSSVALPVFSLEMAGVTHPPLTKREAVIRFLRFLWSSRAKILLIYAAFRFIKKLHEMGRSHHSAPILPLLKSYHPAYIRSASTGLWLFTHAWRVSPQLEKGRVFLIHAYREHIGRYEGLAAQFNAAGLSVYGMDHQGLGQSHGDRGYVSNFSHYIEDYIAFMSHTVEQEGESDKPCFLFGHSMGAAIALQIARIQEWRSAAEAEDRETEAASRASVASANNSSAPTRRQQKGKKNKPLPKRVSVIAEDESWEEEEKEAFRHIFSKQPPRWRVNGLILSAPALIPPSSISPLLNAMASSLADIFPRFGFSSVLPTETSGEPVAVERFLIDPLTYRGHLCARVGHELLEAMGEIRSGLADVNLPLIVLQGKHDTVISPAGAPYLIEHCSSTDKTLKLYDGTHDLYCETENIRQVFVRDILDWIRVRI